MLSVQGASSLARESILDQWQVKEREELDQWWETDIF